MIAAAATVLTLFLAKQTAADEYVFINTASELAQLATNVNSYGSTYFGTTVLLNADLDFDGVSFTRIGGSSYCFKGVFDGQGHTISNLNVKSTDRYASLFGYSRGTTIRNVVLDSSCSFESTYTGTTYTGGILGFSKTYDRMTTIDNCVNMASVSYKQYSGTTSYLGGIVGYHYYYDYDISITNCANYGDVTHTGTYYYNYIGGIAGYIYGSSSYKASIANCINYGTVSVPGSYSSSSSENYMGGIVGYSRAKEISNCLSVGEVQSPSSVPSTAYVGSITGYSDDYNWMSIEHCVWSSSTTGQDGFGNFPSTVTISDCYDVESVNETTMDDMNDYVTDGSKWVFSESYPVSLEVSGRKAIVYNANVILLFNSFTNAAGTYSGWYTDSDCQNLLDSSFVTQTTLYGKWVPVYYTATFVFWEGNEKKESIGVGDIIELPTAIPEREHYIFDRWDSDYEMMPFKDITITAKWTPVTYYVTFDKNNGEEPVETPFAYNSTVTYPSVSRTGYEFLGWDGYVERMPGENVTITAQWEVIYYTATFIILDDNEETKTYKYNDTIEPPTVPEREHYTFNGWNPKYETMPPRNITFTAQWKDILYQVIFDPNNGEDPIVEKLYKYNETVEYPKNVYRTGYEFVEWDKNITNMPDENITITASWKIVYYTATFVDEDTNETKTYFYGNTIKYPEPAGKEGHEFDHWYPHPTKMPARDMDFTAIYKPIKYTVFFVLGDEDLDQQIQVYFGYDVIYPDVVSRTGYEFIEWDKNVTTMPAENVTVTALWKAIDYTLTFFEEDNQVIAVQTLHYKDPVFYPEVATKGTRKFDGWSLAITEMEARDVNITIKRKDIPTSQVKITAKTTDKDRLEKMIDALTDKPFRLDVNPGSGVTTGVVIFEDEVAAEAFMNKVVDELGEGSDAEIVCEYNYYEGYDEKAHREKNTASGAVSLVVSAVALFLAL